MQKFYAAKNYAIQSITFHKFNLTSMIYSCRFQTLICDLLKLICYVCTIVISYIPNNYYKNVNLKMENRDCKKYLNKAKRVDPMLWYYYIWDPILTVVKHSYIQWNLFIMVASGPTASDLYTQISNTYHKVPLSSPCLGTFSQSPLSFFLN